MFHVIGWDSVEWDQGSFIHFWRIHVLRKPDSAVSFSQNTFEMSEPLSQVFLHQNALWGVPSDATRAQFMCVYLDVTPRRLECHAFGVG